MPVVSVILDEVDKSIHTKIEGKIINDIASKIKLPDDILLIKHGGNDLVITDAKGNRSINEDPNTPTTSSKKRMLVTVSNEYEEDDVASAAIHQRSAYPIFLDNDIGLQIYPIYIRNVLKIEFSYITNSMSEAKRIRDYIRLGLTQTRNVIMHDVEYTVIIPRVVEDLIADVYDLKSRLYPEPLENYFNQHATKRMHLITDMANENNKRLAIDEKQTRIIGRFEFNPIPEKVEGDMDTSNYKLSFNYEVTMDIPRAIVMRYPVMICNNLMPDKYLGWISDHKRNSYIEKNRPHNYTSIHNYNLSMLESHQEAEKYADLDLPIVIPDFDDFEPTHGHKGYALLTSLLSTVDEEDKRGLFNLKDLGDDYHISKEIIDYLVNVEYKYVTIPYASFLYMGLWQDDRFYDASVLSMDKELNIAATRDLELTRPVRVTLGLCVDLAHLNEGAIKRLLDYHFLKLEEYNNTVPKLDYPFKSIIETVISEYISIQNAVKYNSNVNSIPSRITTDMLVELIRVLLIRGDIETATKLIDIIKNSPGVTYNRVVIHLHEFYPSIYIDLIKQGLLPNIDPSKVSHSDIKHVSDKNKKIPWGWPSWIIIPISNIN